MKFGLFILASSIFAFGQSRALMSSYLDNNSSISHQIFSNIPESVYNITTHHVEDKTWIQDTNQIIALTAAASSAAVSISYSAYKYCIKREEVSQSIQILKKKTPEVTTLFWIIKIAAAITAETGSEWISGYENCMLPFLCFMSAFVFFSGLQISLNYFSSPIYSAAILVSSLSATSSSQFMHEILGFEYGYRIMLLFSILIFIFTAWDILGNGIDLNNMKSKKIETLYWHAILVSNIIGISIGEYLIYKSGFTILQNYMVTVSFIIFILLLSQFRALNNVGLFWVAFIATYPFEIVLGNYLIQYVYSWLISAIFAAIIIAALIFEYVVKRRSEVQKKEVEFRLNLPRDYIVENIIYSTGDSEQKEGVV